MILSETRAKQAGEVVTAILEKESEIQELLSKFAPNLSKIFMKTV